MEKIEIDIAADGTIKYGVSGVKGGKCVDLTKLIDNLAGGKVTERKKTGEFCQVETVTQKQGQG